MKIRSLFSRRNLIFFGVVVLATLMPIFLKGNQYLMVLVTTVLFYGILASAWHIIGGMANQFDLGAFAYVGLGSFTAGTLFLRWNITPWIGMFAGGFLAVILAMLIGFPLFRFKVRELWYSLSSIALVSVMQVLCLLWPSVGGPMEYYLSSTTEMPRILSLRYPTYEPYYYIYLVILVVVLLVIGRIRYSKLGYSLLALGEDEDAVEALGVNSQVCKLKALAIYAFVCGLVGAIYAFMYGVYHNTYFSTPMSVEVSILGIVGGLGFIYGPLMATVLLVTIKETLRANLSGSLESAYLIIYGVILIFVVLYQPKGLAYMLGKLGEKMKAFFAEMRHGHTTNA